TTSAPGGSTSPSPNATPEVPPVTFGSGGVGFGFDAGSLSVQKEAGLQPQFATIWIGPWDSKQGWLQPDRQLAELHAQGVTPAVHLYYWGDDLAPSCLAVGCHGKDVAGWADLTHQLTDHLQ